MSAVLTPKLETLCLAKTPLFMVRVRLPGKVKCSYLGVETTPGRSAELLSKALIVVIDTVFHSCRISRVASLDFDMTLGGCATSRGFTVLCFDRNATQKCYYTRYGAKKIQCLLNSKSITARNFQWSRWFFIRAQNHANSSLLNWSNGYWKSTAGPCQGFRTQNS